MKNEALEALSALDEFVASTLEGSDKRRTAARYALATIRRSLEHLEGTLVEGWVRKGSGSPYHDGVDWRMWATEKCPGLPMEFAPALLIIKGASTGDEK